MQFMKRAIGSVVRPTTSRVQRRSGERGGSLVEYALVIGFIFFPLLFGIVGFGHALYAYHFVNNIAKEATRWASVNGGACKTDLSCNGTAPMNSGPANETDVKNYVNNHAPSGIDSTKITTSACGVLAGTLSANAPACQDSTQSSCTAATPNIPGCAVEVQVTYNFHFIVPYISTSPLTLSSTSEMTIIH
jgi:Flp pilus assembly protein TadG